MKQPKYVRQPQYDQQNADAWEVAADHVEGDGWTGKRIVYTPVGADPNKKRGDDARAQ